MEYIYTHSRLVFLFVYLMLYIFTAIRFISAWQALETAKVMADAKDADGKAILTLGRKDMDLSDLSRNVWMIHDSHMCEYTSINFVVCIHRKIHLYACNPAYICMYNYMYIYI